MHGLMLGDHRAADEPLGNQFPLLPAARNHLVKVAEMLGTGGEFGFEGSKVHRCVGGHETAGVRVEAVDSLALDQRVDEGKGLIAGLVELLSPPRPKRAISVVRSYLCCRPSMPKLRLDAP